MQHMLKITGTPNSFQGDSEVVTLNAVKSSLSCTMSLLLYLLLMVSLTGCESEDVSDLHAYVKEVKARKKGPIPKLPKVEAYETYAYDSSELRDPFASTKSGRSPTSPDNDENKPDMTRVREVLEEFPLDTLKMVGALERDGQRWALIKSEDGTLYRTRKGHYIGQNFGKIKRITETEIEISETVQDGLDGWVKRQTTLSVTE